MKKILVTGGAGFIGTNLVGKLLDREDTEVICLDNFDSFYPPDVKRKNTGLFCARKNFRLIEGDIRSPSDLREVPAPDIIIHLAAMAGVRQSFRDPGVYNAVNVTGTMHLLEFARRAGVSQFIFASSSSIYGDSGGGQPMGEDLIPDLRSPYAVSKYMAELTGRQYSRRWGIRFLALRFFSVYGPGQRPDQIVSTLFRSAMEGFPVVLSGNGRSTRDYTFVDDIVTGIMAAMSYKGSDFEIINLGRGQQVRLTELLHLVESITHKRIEVACSPRHPADALYTCADIAKAGDLLQYHPLTGIADGLWATFRTLAPPAREIMQA